MSKTVITSEYRIDSDTQTIGELWQSIASLAKGRVEDNILRAEDNTLSEDYPLNIREIQIAMLKSLVETIETTHKKMKKEVIKNE